jgi:hypothetical protein
MCREIFIKFGTKVLKKQQNMPSLHWQITSSLRIPQVLIEARVGWLSGEFAIFFDHTPLKWLNLANCSILL